MAVSASPPTERAQGPAGAALPPSSGTGPREPRGSSLLPLLFGLLLAAAVGFLVWYLLVRNGDEEALPPVPAGEVSVDVTRLDFGDTDVGARSLTLTVAVTNGRTDAVRVEDVAVEGDAAEDFELADAACLNARLDPGDVCALSVRFRPTQTGERPARLVISLDGGPGERIVVLAGAGVGRATLIVETSRLDFGARRLDDEEGEPQQVTLVNAGNLPLHIRRAGIEGPAAGDYRLGRRARCLGERGLPAGSSCVLSVSFAPSEPSERPAVLVLAHDGAEAPARIQLRGSGAGQPQVVLAPAAATFGGVDVGSASEARTITLRSTGTAPARISWIGLAGPDSEAFRIGGAGTCQKGSTPEPGTSCTIAVRFVPPAAGPLTAAVVVATDDPAGFAEVELRGTGTAVEDAQGSERQDTSGEESPTPEQEPGAERRADRA